uniref:Venom toxin n=1 Tax=Hemiscorpius lepturus TaxID=520031 RepID=A0A1L4BJ75_HEMLE|nr:venom toxin [Hemiscorpius lepturus]
MVKVWLVTLVVLAVSLRATIGLRCRECGTYECRPPPRNCPAGTVKDVCNCCIVCAKGLNEECGGPWDLAGKCGNGLTCVKRTTSPNARGRCRRN